MLLTDPDALQAIAQVLGASIQEAPYQTPRRDENGDSLPVYQLTMRSEEMSDDLLVTVWPGQSRVDVRLRKSYWVLRDISEVEIYPGIEVLFRRAQPSALLFISARGRVALVA